MKRLLTAITLAILSLPAFADDNTPTSDAAGVTDEKTSTNDGSILPYPQTPFKCVIKKTAKDSTPDFPKGVKAPDGAPNILLILTDDVGFGASSTFGGPIQTPTFQKEADKGLRYTMFHTTAL